ncbi:MAG: hypothetical protein C5B55_02690 [Blastocatellia bacterium]|nr:MAG: hypothetical protein C5B55_02690 [Blastocatellia bacterium]
MKSILNSVVLPLFIIAALFIVLIVHPELEGSRAIASSSLAPVAPTIKSESQIKSEASLYETAIREIGQITQLNLATPEVSKTAQGVLAKQIPNLRLNRSKLVAFGLNDSSFVSAVKARAGDKKSAQQFAMELGNDHSAILKLSGAQSVATRIRSSAEADNLLLTKVAALLKQAAADIKANARAHHAHIKAVARTTSESTHLLAPSTLSSEDTTLLVVAAAIVICPVLGLVIFELAASVAVIVFYVALLTTPFLIVGGTADKVQECEDKARKNCDNCKDDASKLVFPLNIAAADACDAELLFEITVCMATLGLV